MPQILASRVDSVVNSTAEKALQPVVVARGGGHAVFWVSPIADPASSSAALYANADIKGRLFDSAGRPVGGDFTVNATTAGAQYRPSAIRLSDGHLLVAWQDGVLSGSGTATLRAREFTSDGAPVGGEFVITGPANAILPALTPLADSGFAAVWLSPVGGAISLQRFDADNVAVGPVITVGTSTDTVIADIDGAGYYLYPNAENLTLIGETPFGVGNDLANILTGNAIGNYLLGGAGNDTLNGGAGNDVLFGEEGADTFVFGAGTGGDVIGDFAVGVDRIDLSAFGFADFAALQGRFVEVAGTSAIDLGNGDFIVINGVANARLGAASFLLG